MTRRTAAGRSQRPSEITSVGEAGRYQGSETGLWRFRQFVAQLAEDASSSASKESPFDAEVNQTDAPKRNSEHAFGWSNLLHEE